MKFQIFFSPEAEHDIANLLDYLIREANGRVAHEYVDRIVDFCLGLETFPMRGSRRDDLLPGLRIVGYRRRASIAFQVDGDIVTIVRVFHRGQDIIFEYPK